MTRPLWTRLARRLLPVPALLVLLATPSLARADDAAIRAAAKSQCFGTYLKPAAVDAARAAALMRGRLTMAPHPEVSIPVDLDWTEDPLGDANWRFNLHALRWTDVLRREFARTGDVAMKERHQAYLQDWIADNPRESPPSPYSYNDMATGLRAIVLSCAIGTYGPEAWLMDALHAHGTVLSDPAFGSQSGNHALHVRNGLLVAGCVTGVPAWVSNAAQRIESLLAVSVDAAGVTDEGSTSYQAGNYNWYSESRTRLTACDVTPSSVFDRLARMPDFLAHATTPGATYEQIGDSSRTRASAIAGTTLEYAATQGARGIKPTGVFKTYDRGYVFARSGWGENRPFARETFYSLRYGLPMNQQVHAHYDAGALTMHAYNDQLLFDSGRFRYGGGAMESYTNSRAAHNTVDVPGASYNRTVATPLTTSSHTARRDLVTIHHTALTGTTWIRTVLYSRTGNYFVVDDRVQSSAPVQSVQRWHVPTGRSFYKSGGSISTSGAGADVRFYWLGNRRPAVTTAQGQENPFLGWRGYVYGTVFPSPVIEARLFGPTARYTTVIVPRYAGSSVPVTISDAKVSPNFMTATITVNGRTEAVRLATTSASVTPVD